MSLGLRRISAETSVLLKRLLLVDPTQKYFAVLVGLLLFPPLQVYVIE
jgi:hypothetical protein